MKTLGFPQSSAGRFGLEKLCICCRLSFFSSSCRQDIPNPLKSKHILRNKYNRVLYLQLYSKNEAIFYYRNRNRDLKQYGSGSGSSWVKMIWFRRFWFRNTAFRGLYIENYSPSPPPGGRQNISQSHLGEKYEKKEEKKGKM
jgi:hypothetical protein